MGREEGQTDRGPAEERGREGNDRGKRKIGKRMRAG